VRAKALRCAGLLAAKQGDYERALSLSGASLAHYQELGDKAGIARVLNDMGEAARKQGDYEQALPLYEKSLALRRELGHKAGVAAVLNNLGAVASAQGDYQKAISLYEESLALERELGNKEGIAVSLANLGGVALDQGDIAQALTLYKEGLTLGWELGYKDFITYCLEELVKIAVKQGCMQSEQIAHMARSDTAGHIEEHFVRAARLWGAAEALRTKLGTLIPPSSYADYEHHVAMARAHLNEETFAQALQDGRSMSLEQAIAYALETTVITPALSTDVSDQTSTSTPAEPAPIKSSLTLSQRERQIVTLIVAGRTNREIAAELGISPRTADTHISHILSKLGFTSRAQIAAWAREQQLTPLSTT